VTQQDRSPRKLCFVDSSGGALAAIGAAVAQSLGRAEAVAATATDPQPLPQEVSTALKEVAMRVPDVVRLREIEAAGVTFVFLGSSPPPEPIADAQAWSLALYQPPAGAADRQEPDDLERISGARIVRDRIERRLEVMLAAPEGTPR
jgi:hypothetical protein